METFILVAFIWMGGRLPEQVRTPDLPELQCKLMRLQIDRARGRGWCEIQGRPEPVWNSAPTIRTPECADCRTIRERGRAPA